MNIIPFSPYTHVWLCVRVYIGNIHVLVCITRIEEMMLCDCFMCILRGFRMISSTEHHTPLIEILFPSTPFHITLDGWHLGVIWCTCICWSDACVSLDLCRSLWDPPRGCSYQHHPQRSWWHVGGLRESFGTERVSEYVSHK